MNPLFSVGVRDFGKGLVVAVISAVVTFVYGVVNSGTLSIDMHQVLVVAVASALGYVCKNYLSDDSGKFLGHV